MKTFKVLLLECMDKSGCKTNGAIAKYLGIHRGGLAQVLEGKAKANNEMCVKVAQILGKKAIEIIACVEYERAHNDEIKELWVKIMKDEA